MNPQNHDDLTDQVGRALHHQADGISRSPITLGDVKGTATRIRRRRALTASAAVAAAVAIIVPTVAFNSSLFQNADDNPGPPASQNPTPNNVRLGEPLQVEGLPDGEPAKIAWIENGRTLHLPGGNTTTLDRAYSDVVSYDSGFLATYIDREGVATGVLLDDRGSAAGESFATAYSVALSADGVRILYVADGRLLLHDNLTGATDTIRTGVGPETDPIAVTDEVAYYNVPGADGMRDARFFENGTEHDPQPAGTYFYRSVTEDGWVTAVDEVTDDGSCSVVVAPDGAVAGRTCDFTLDAFSPDGSHLLAGPSYRSGYGDGQLAVTERDGVGRQSAVVLEYLQTAPDNATFMEAVWEDETHVLVITSQPIPADSDRTWQLIRLGLDGSAENVAVPVRAGEFPRVAPFAFVS
jgi:hypothetical protein